MKKILYCGITLVMMLGIFVGCRANKYNAIVCDEPNRWLREDFLSENLISGAYYDEKIYTDDIYPSSRTFIIDNNECFNEIFQSSSLDVNFEREMLVLHTFVSIYTRPIEIKEVSVEESVLQIEFIMGKAQKGTGDAIRPFQRYLLVKLDKLAVTSAEFEQKI